MFLLYQRHAVVALHVQLTDLHGQLEMCWQQRVVQYVCRADLPLTAMHIDSAH